MAHGGEPERRPVLEALVAALSVIDRDHAGLYADIVRVGLPAAARDYLEARMNLTTHPHLSGFARHVFAEGEAKGEAKAVLAFLEARGFTVPDDVREKIVGCADPDQLDIWVRRAATVGKIDDLFE